MMHSRTSFPGGFRTLVRLAFYAGWVLGVGSSAHGQLAVTQVIEPSPMIARGHLEGGINGEGAPRPDRKTPLMLAVEADDLKVIEYLLQHGADLELRDAAGETASDLARRRPSHGAAGLLDAHALSHRGVADYYAGKIPVLSVVSARSQSGSPGCAAAHPLVVAVADRAGHPLVDAPVRFAVEGGGKNLLTQASSPDSPSLLLRTDESGRCRVNVNLPKEPNVHVRIVATAGSPEQASRVTFTALTNDGTGGDSVSCYDPTEVQVSMSPSGDCDLTWQNNTDDEIAIKVWVRMPEGWQVVATLPPRSTSAHIPNK